MLPQIAVRLMHGCYKKMCSHLNVHFTDVDIRMSKKISVIC